MLSQSRRHFLRLCSSLGLITLLHKIHFVKILEDEEFIVINGWVLKKEDLGA